MSGASLCIVLPGNRWHSDLSASAAARCRDELCGLEAIGNSGIPVAVSLHGMDFWLMPELWKLLNSGRYPNITLLSAPFSHSLLSWCDLQYAEWEFHHGVGVETHFLPAWKLPQSDVRGEVIVLPEFAWPPDLGGYLCPRALMYGPFTSLEPRRDPEWLAERGVTEMDGRYAAYQGKPGDPRFEKPDIVGFCGAGIRVMQYHNQLLDGFFRFQRGLLTSDQLLALYRRGLNALPPEKTVVMPIDLEAPWVGGLGGAVVWERFLSLLAQSDLRDRIISVEEMWSRNTTIDRFVFDAPSRRETKWTHFPQQRLLRKRLESLPRHTDRDRFRFAIASCADVFSCLYRTEGRKYGAPFVLSFPTMVAGTAGKIKLDADPDITRIGLSAMDAMERGVPLVDLMHRRLQGRDAQDENFDGAHPLVREVFQFAQERGL